MLFEVKFVRVDGSTGPKPVRVDCADKRGVLDHPDVREYTCYAWLPIINANPKGRHDSDRMSCGHAKIVQRVRTVRGVSESYNYDRSKLSHCTGCGEAL